MVKDVRDLRDLQEAAEEASVRGESIIRLPSGRTFVIIPEGDEFDDRSDPGLVEALERGLTDLENGQWFSSEELRQLLQDRRLRKS